MIGIALGIYPNLPSSTPKKVDVDLSSSTSKKVDKTTFYMFAGLIILSSLGQTIEKSITLIKSRGKLSGQEFVQKYTNILMEAINTITLLPLEKAQIEEAQKLLLKSISLLVQLYYEEKTGLKISANLMLPREIKDYMPAEQFRQQVKFIDDLREPDTYQCVLSLTLWSDPKDGVGVPLNFTIPVDKDNKRLLFGAPKAYISNNITVVEDINSSTELDIMVAGQSPRVASEIRDFLKQMKYRSFISWPLTLSNKTIGIVNIQSNYSHILGKKQEQIEEVKKYISPLINILTILTSSKAIKNP